MKVHILILRAIFIIFDVVLGLHINWKKSFIYPIDEVGELQCLATKVGNLPTTYLGMPLGANSTSIAIWNGVLEKCEKKLSNWKSKYLSRGGRLTLVNSVLDALPAYIMWIFPTPINVIKRIENIRRDFFWQGTEDKNKFHLVKWERKQWERKHEELEREI